MSAAIRKWLIVGITLGYFIAVHLAFLHHSPRAAAAAVALLFLLALAAIKGPRRLAWRVVLASLGAGLVTLTARGAPPLPLLLPPVLIPAAIAFVFGRTLVHGRTPLVEGFARGFYAPVVPGPEILSYARVVTWAWTLLLASIALANAALAMSLSPGGMLELAGLAPPVPVAPATFVWFSNTGTYLLIAAGFVLEFALRVWRFPEYRFRNPLHFIREARTRLPNIVAALRQPRVKTLSVPAGHPIFAGHFPGRPIVPGVMLLEWVLDEIARARNCARVSLRIREAKFFTPLGPAESAALRLDLAPSRCSFAIHRDSDTIARGVVDWPAHA